MPFFLDSVIMDKTQRTRVSEKIQADLAKARTTRKMQMSARPALRTSLRAWQRERLKTTHALALTDPGTSAAARFFLDEIYPVSTAAWRDSQAFAALSSLCKLLPDAALEALAAAAAMDSLTEELDAQWCDAWQAARLGENASNIVREDYEDAYRQCDKILRERQLEALAQASHSLTRISGMTLASAALRAMKLPAKLAGLSDLQEFLERGYRIFSDLKQPDVFCRQLHDRETAFMLEILDSKIGGAPPRV
jgi:hypothetical protein